MLNLCDAVCISPRGDRTMQHLAEKVGFRSAASVGVSGGDVEPRGPICFYFVDYRIEDPSKRQILSRLRASPLPNIRFAPVIIVLTDCPADTVVKYAMWGFDDIIALPEQAPRLAARLEAQLNRECLYYETDAYFGPDRRTRARAALRPGDRPSSRVVEHRFVREPFSGVRVIRTKAPETEGLPGIAETLRRLAGG